MAQDITNDNSIRDMRFEQYRYIVRKKKQNISNVFFTKHVVCKSMKASDKKKTSRTF